MPNTIERRLRLAVMGLVFTSYFGLTSTFRYDTSLLLIPLMAHLLMPLGEYLNRKFKIYQQLTSFIVFIFVLSIPFLIRSLTLLDGVIALVIFIQVYSLLHRKRIRNYAHIILMAFFLLLAASVMSPRASIGLVFFFFAIFATGTLMLLEMLSAQQRVQGIGADVTFRDSGNAQLRVNGVPAFSLSMVSGVALLGVAVVLLMSVLFFFTPRTEAGLLGGRPSTTQFTPGLTAEIDFASAGVLSSSAAPVMRVQFPDEPEGVYDGELLWRATALDGYTGDKWVRRGLETRISRDRPDQIRFRTIPGANSNDGLDRLPFKEGRPVKQEIFLDHFPEVGIPSLYMIKSILPMEENKSLRFRWDRAADFTAEPTPRAERGVYLEIEAEVPQATAQELRDSSERYLTVMIDSDYRHLTYHNLLPETLALVQDITENAPTAYDKVSALEAWLGGGEFVYSSVIPVLPESNPIDAFILNEKSGHCELYATALALTVRSLGIPARVVNGYRGGMWDASDRSYMITNDMAHLWTEVFFPDYGWLPFDPSPVEDDSDVLSLDTLARVYSRYALRAQILWLRNVESYSPARANALFRDQAVEVFRGMGDAWEALSLPGEEVSIMGRARRPLFVLIVLSTFIAFAFLLLRLLRPRRRQRQALTIDQQRAIQLHALLTRKFKRFGFDCAGKTAEEIGEGIDPLNLEDPGSARYILRKYNAARFGSEAFNSADFADMRLRLRQLKVASC